MSQNITKETHSFPAIYKITNVINGKIYVGSAKNMYQRYCNYRVSEKDKKQIRYIARAIQKYGFSNFEFHILEVVESPESLIAREQYWIDLLNPFEKNGYNLAKYAGSTLGVSHTIETRKKISEKAKNRIVSQETKNRLKLTQKIRSDAAVQACSKPVYKIEANTLKIVAEYASGADAAKAHFTGTSLISHVCKRTNTHKAFGFHFCFVETYKAGKFNPKKLSYIGRKHRDMIPIIQSNLDGSFVKEWASSVKITENLGLDCSSILKCCRGEREQAYKFKWAFIQDEEKIKNFREMLKQEYEQRRKDAIRIS